MKQMFATIFFCATLVNFYHFYQYFENFSSLTLEKLVGNDFIQNNRFWILLSTEHILIGLFIVVNLFGKGRLNFVQKKRQT